MSTNSHLPYLKITAFATGIIAIAILVYFIHLVRPLVLYLLFAYFFVTCFRGISNAANDRFHLPKFLTYVLIAGGFSFLVYLFTFIITDTIRDLIAVQQTYKDLFVEKLKIVEEWLTRVPGVQNVNLRSAITDIPIQPLLTQILNDTVSIFRVLFTFIIFLIAESLDNYTRISDRLGIRQTHFYEVMSQFQSNIQRYLVIKTFISAGTGLMVYTLLSFFEIDFALLWALLTFLLNYLPVVGSVVATILPMFVIVVTQDFGSAALLLLLLIVNQIFWGQFLDPKLVGDEFNLKFKTILVSIFLWGSLLGIGGVILSPLLTLAIKLICEGHPSWKWVSVILSRRHEPLPPAAPSVNAGESV